MIRPKQAVAIMVLSCGFVCLGQEQQSGASAVAVRMTVIKGMPFSANAVTESTQTLADGNRIIRKNSVRVARDSEGRTRREQKLPRTDLSIIWIQDPVAGSSYVLDTRSASARVVPIQALDGSEAPPVTAGSNTESMGTQFIEGFLAEGTRLKQTISAEKAASERPLEIISETWYSPQLEIILRNKTIDPRVGVVDYKITEIQLGEPARSLFEVPKDYTVTQEPLVPRTLVIEKSKDN